ncbi:hypothetical protein STEG23_028899, partial [Scotinomys teguina]
MFSEMARIHITGECHWSDSRKGESSDDMHMATQEMASTESSGDMLCTENQRLNFQILSVAQNKEEENLHGSGLLFWATYTYFLASPGHARTCVLAPTATAERTAVSWKRAGKRQRGNGDEKPEEAFRGVQRREDKLHPLRKLQLTCHCDSLNCSSRKNE